MNTPDSRKQQDDSRDKAGRFRKGVSGNPGGRSTKTAELRRVLESGADDAVKTIMEAAKGGDMAACRLILDRVVPPSKPVYQPVSFELDDSDLSAAARSVVKAIAAGELPADQGKMILEGLANMTKIIEVQEIVERLNALEAKQ
ncbi:TPA: hypothetical protein L9W62_000052 [Klebsiella pneumoniae]|nr:hypothetical protein [Klebsiella pneumoniae]